MSDTVRANDGTQLPLASLTQTFTYDGTNISTISVDYQAYVDNVPVTNTYTQTFTYDGDNVSSISGWVLQ